MATPSPPLRPSDKSTPHETASPALPVVGAEALQRELTIAPADKFIVVMFQARWCRVCKTLSSKLSRVAERFPNVVWLGVDHVEVPNKELCSQLNVKLLPTFRFYQPGAAIDDALDHFTIGPFGAKRLIERLEDHRSAGHL